MALCKINRLESVYRRHHSLFSEGPPVKRGRDNAVSDNMHAPRLLKQNEGHRNTQGLEKEANTLEYIGHKYRAAHSIFFFYSTFFNVCVTLCVSVIW